MKAMHQLMLDLAERRRTLDCTAPVCERPCHCKVCPYAIEAARTKWMSAYKRRRVFGPVPWFMGRWLETVLGFNPWGDHGAR